MKKSSAQSNTLTLSSQNNAALFIGRFQPFHNGHLQVIKDILKNHPTLHIIIGSAQESHTKNNPLTIQERLQIIQQALKETNLHNYTITPLTDINNDDLWVTHLNAHLKKPYTTLYTGRARVKNCFQKSTPHIKITPLPRHHNISATKVRQLLLKNQPYQHLLPPTVAKLLKQWNIAERLQIVQNKAEN